MNELLLVGFGVAICLVTVWLIAPLCAAASNLLPARSARWSALHGTLALLPIAIGLGVTVSLLSPETLSEGCHCISHPHHPHLCLQHAAFSWVLVAGCAVAVAASLRITRSMSSLLSEYRLTQAWAEALRATRTERVDGMDLEICSQVGPRALTVGLFRSRIVIGEALWSVLDGTARRAIAAHEKAHAARRDPLTLLVLRAAACFMPARAGARLVGRWRRAAELSCDRIAARWLGDPCAIASALVTCGRVQREPKTFATGVTLAAADRDDLEMRVSCLLEPQGTDKATPSARGDLLDLALATVTISAAIVVLSGHGAHHAVETIIGWIS